MSFAPLDVWWRLLFRSPAAIPPRFWARLSLALVLSLFFTILTLPERLLTGLWLRLRRSPRRPIPGPVIILGYYRSGTTLLQYVLGCDSNLYAPNYAQAFAPQGYWFSWMLLRWFILPFMPRTRPGDNVGFGLLVPAEDDFALNNWGLASTLPGRLVLPQAHRFFDRFHDLSKLTTAERVRWEYCQKAFVRKLATLAGSRRILLKTPAHTGRIPALLNLYADTTGPKFIYISRNPHKVFRSNVTMLQRWSRIYGLQAPLAAQELQNYLLEEYLATEREYQRTRTLIPAGSLVEIRLEDLQADPLGTLRRVYAELGLSFTPALEEKVIAYLNRNRDYQLNAHPPWSPAEQEKVDAALKPLVEQGRHDRPAIARVPLPAPKPTVRRHEIVRAVARGLVAALVCMAAGAGLARVHIRDWLWPCGVAIGASVLRGASNQGSTRLGAYALGLTLAVTAGRLVFFYSGLHMSTSGLLLTGLALFAAYRIGSQQV